MKATDVHSCTVKNTKYLAMDGRAETDGNLLSRYPDADIYGYPADSDIIRLVLLAIYFKFINTS